MKGALYVEYTTCAGHERYKLRRFDRDEMQFYVNMLKVCFGRASSGKMRSGSLRECIDI